MGDTHRWPPAGLSGGDDPPASRTPVPRRGRGRSGAVARYVATALSVFVLALLLVTGIEVVLGHPLSGGAPGATTLGEIVRPAGR